MWIKKIYIIFRFSRIRGIEEKIIIDRESYKESFVFSE